jgi:hypothetical protein
MPDMTTYLQTIRDKLARNAAIKAWCTTYYARIHRVAVGNDEQVPFVADYYPLISIAPNSQVMGDDADLEKGFQITCGVYRDGADAYSLIFPGLSEGTNSATIKVGAFTFSIAGTLYTKAATDNIAMTACAQQAASKYCFYLVSIGTTGTITVTKGTDANTSDAATVPALPASSAPVGTILVQTDAGHTFTAGTTDLSGAGITATIQDWNIIEFIGVREVEALRALVVNALSELGRTMFDGLLAHIDVEYEVTSLYPFFLAGVAINWKEETDFESDGWQ